jgi:NAD(P)-dependent dehydrogenase (short-subunit alcohol dehydrogenase family)
MKLKSKIGLITGASQGLGKAIACAFVKEGADVAICARDSELIELAAEDLRARAVDGQRVFAAVCDVSSSDQVDRLFSDISAQLGPVEILVNNAGVYGPKGPSESVSFVEWARAIEINLYGVFLPCQQAIRSMKRGGRGKIINLSGGGATAPLPRFSAYAASKAAVVRLTETLAEELRGYSIDVNAIAPGALNTRMLGEVLSAGSETVGKEYFDKAVKQRDSGGVPLERAAGLSVYLASESSDGITGKLISAQWDPWQNLHVSRDQLAQSDVYTLRRIVPEDRGLKW